MTSNTDWLYVGDEWIPGVPKRTLTAAEYEQHRERIEAVFAVTNRRLYVPLAPVEGRIAELATLLERIDTAPRLTFGEPLDPPVHPAEVIAAEDDLPDFEFTGDEAESQPSNDTK